MTLLEKLDRLPPIVCRLLAETDGQLATDLELQHVTGWGKSKFERIAFSKTWAGISVRDVDRFLAVCQLSWSSQKRERQRLYRALRLGIQGLKRLHHLKRPVAARKSRVHSLLKRTERVLRNSQPQ